MSLAIKNAPKKWEDVKFQGHITTVLQNAIIQGELPNAILLQGGSGRGKTSISLLTAASSACTNKTRGSADPCGECPSCKDIFSGSFSMNVRLVNAGKEGVAFFREYLDAVENMGSIFGGPRFLLVDEAHRLSKEALDTLLTPLENPSNSNLFFIFSTTDMGKKAMTETLKSRTSHYVVSRPNTDEFIGHILEIMDEMKWDIPEEKLIDIAGRVISLAEGNVRESLNVIHKLNLGKDFSDDTIGKLLNTDIGTNPVRNIVYNLLSENPKLAIPEIEKMFKESSGDIFKMLFEETVLVRRVLLGLGASPKSLEKTIEAKYSKKIAGGYDTQRLGSKLLQAKRDSGEHIDMNIILFYLTST
jgi:DNA polymerase-3 subunit gamma/tau